MPLVIPPARESPKSSLPKGGSPKGDAAYLVWRDNLLNTWSERLVVRHWHSFDLLELMPAWRFDSLLFEALGGNPPLFASSASTPHLNYSHRLRFLSIELERHPRRVRSLAARILEGSHLQ